MASEGRRRRSERMSAASTADPSSSPSATGALEARIARLFPMLGAGEGTVARIVGAGHLRRVTAGTTMFDSHSPCSGFPLVLEGRVRVVQRYPNGRELELYRVRPGESCLLAGSCLMSRAEYDATALAETDVELLLLPPAAFETLMAGDDAFRRHVLANFGERLAAMMQVVEAIAYQKLDQRLARLLVERAGAGGNIRVTHQALADALGSVREIVTRLLRNFEDRGWVELGRERVSLVDRAALDRLAAG
jgi:CRP/FNR family transcriptional regulator